MCRRGDIQISGVPPLTHLNPYATHVGLLIHNVIHGFRHSFRDRLRAVSAPIDMIDQLAGWSLQSVGQGYGDGYSINAVCEILGNAVL